MIEYEYRTKQGAALLFLSPLSDHLSWLLVLSGLGGTPIPRCGGYTCINYLCAQVEHRQRLGKFDHIIEGSLASR